MFCTLIIKTVNVAAHSLYFIAPTEFILFAIVRKSAVNIMITVESIAATFMVAICRAAYRFECFFGRLV